MLKLFAKGAFLKSLVQKVENERRFAKMCRKMIVYSTCKHVEIALKIVSKRTLLVFSELFSLSQLMFLVRIFEMHVILVWIESCRYL